MRTTIATILFLGALGVIAASGKITGLDGVPVTEDPASPREDSGPSTRPAPTATTTTPDSGGPTCIPQGQSGCSDSEQCCKPTTPVPGSSVTCNTGSASCTTCKGANALCGDTELCCSGRPCNPTTGTCPNECRVSGVACENDGQCCDPTDASAKFECRADKKCTKCAPAGAACSGGSECCGTLKCKSDKKCGSCLAANATGCTNNDDCCTGVCSTDVDNPTVTRCVEKCWPQWSLSNVATPCKNAQLGFESRPCCAPFKCNFDIPQSEAIGCGN